MKIEKVITEEQLNQILGMLIETRNAQEEAAERGNHALVAALSKAFFQAKCELEEKGDTTVKLPSRDFLKKGYFINVGAAESRFIENGMDSDVDVSAFGKDAIATVFNTELVCNGKHPYPHLDNEYITIYSIDRPKYDEDGDIEGYENIGFFME